MILLLGIMSFAGVLALSGGISGLDILGMSEEHEGIDQAMPPPDKDIETDPTIVQQISGGSLLITYQVLLIMIWCIWARVTIFMMVSRATQMLVMTPFMAKKEMTQSAIAVDPTFYIVKRAAMFLNAVDHTDHMGSDTLIGGTGKDLLQGDAGDVMMGGGDVDQFEVFIRNEQAPTDQCVHILDFDPEVDKLVIRIDEPIEQAANSDRVIMTYDSQSDATHVFADGKKVAEIFGAYPSDLQDFRIGNFAQIA